jgi:heme-degrading monooxygenase HmoA
MFTRVVAIQVRTGKSRELSRVIQDQILPILREEPGFVDEIVLHSNMEANQILALSFWETEQDAERYTHEQFPRINKLISHLVENAPVSRTFTVDIFSSHNIVGGVAA